jgi:hypothetical protein
MVDCRSIVAIRFANVSQSFVHCMRNRCSSNVASHCFSDLQVMDQMTEGDNETWVLGSNSPVNAR